MRMTLPEGEPAAGPWRAVTHAQLAAELLSLAGAPTGRPTVLAINGRSGSGKSTLAHVLAPHLPAAIVIGTDDLCWWEPMFEWADIPTQYLLEPLHRSQPVGFQPPAWVERGRAGRIEVPEGTRTLILEGVGADQRPFSHLIDVTVWVQSDLKEAERRGIARDIAAGDNGDEAESIAFWHEWQRHEVAFYQQDRPWERAALTVAGTTTIPLGAGQVAVAPPPGS